MKNILHRFGLQLVCLAVIFSPNLTLAQVSADFEADETSGCSPLIVNFQNLSTGSDLSYQWDLGNGNTSVSENPSASYINSGTYSITLTVTGTGGTDTEVKTAFITVFTPPTPDISPSQTIGCYPFSVDFTDLSSLGDSPIATWSWDFGDGGTSTDQNPTHQYSTPGTFDITLLLTDENGCASNLSFNDLIESNNNVPTAEFTGDPLVSCLPPVDVNFSNTSFGGTGNLTYEWDFGNGNTSTDQFPTNSYLNADSYDISLTITDELGCSDTSSETDYIVIVDDVTVNFIATSTTICLGEQVSFVDLSTPDPTSWEWDLGDGTTSTNEFVTHLYTSPGTYEVSLTATYSASCQGTEAKTGYITVGEIPFVDFVADVVTACENPLDVNFTNSSIGNGNLTYAWSFGDGNVSTEENPSNTYADFGNYTVSLTATNDDGCSSTVTNTNYINITETSADFLPDVFGFCQPLEVNFSDLSVSGNAITSYEWDFGDGGTSTESNPTYLYADTGIFDVSLIIVNDLGCTDTLTRTNYIFVYTPPDTDFLVGDTLVCPGQEIQFTDQSQNVTDWFWAFGDGETSTDQHPTYEYQDTGFFDITLITLNNGCSDTLTLTDAIYVTPPVARFASAFDCSDPNTFTFSNSSFGYDSWEWQLPDGSTSTEDPLTLILTEPGMYILRLAATNDEYGCTTGARDTLYVTDLEAGFSAQNTQDCAPLDVIFTDESTDAQSWEWFFGNGAYSQEQNPSYTYSEVGSYTVTHVVTDINGCTDTISEPDLVTVTGSIVDFGVDTTFGCDTLAVQFADLTDPPGSVADWLWDFGDGNTSTEQNPLHIYQNAGVYDVTLTTTDIGGCVNSTAQPSLVNYIPYPVPDFEVNNTLGCMGQPFSFTNNSTGNAVSYLWNFGDGGTSTEESPVYSYNSEGVFSVTLTAFNANGCDSSFTEISLIDIQHPDADFSAFPTFAFCPPLLVSFTDLSSVDAISWFWDFGDGSSSSLQNPGHIYTESGIFSVLLVVTNSNGCTDTIFAPELVELSGPSGDFSFFPDTVGCPPYEITFTSNVTNVTTYTWDFGDGFLGSGETITHSYAQIGSYVPTLILEDDKGCTFTYQSDDTLSIEPLAVDAGSSEIICQADSVQLNATGGDSYSWSPAAGLNDSNSASPQASPSVTTQYVVTVMLGLCQNTDTLTVIVNPSPQVSFSSTEVCFGIATQFTDLSSIADPDNITSWNWDLDQTVSNDTNPSITYSQAGTYNVSLQL
ncbi:MAG: PKD domain-containing protein, partial [Flavobacteriales bacterium]|nr:PKD domain-containing protein [Flavobacteriales bacterium]